MKKLLLFPAAILLVGIIAYLLGPAPAPPSLAPRTFAVPSEPDKLTAFVQSKEGRASGLRPDNQARILWADDSHRKTPVAFVYIHGFSASQEEGDPVHINVAKHFGGNLYLSRLARHGVNNGNRTMEKLTADELIDSAEEALAIGRQLGDEVVVIGTSMGGALTAYLAAQHPDLKAVVLYSPCIRIYNSASALLSKPWGLQIARQIYGNDHTENKPKNSLHRKYWTMNYRLEALVALQNFLTYAMTPETFEKIKTPMFLGYYYKDEEHQDKVVSVEAMKEMFAEIATPADQKTSVAFPNANNHVIASYVLSDDWQSVQKETIAFLDKVLAKK